MDILSKKKAGHARLMLPAQVNHLRGVVFWLLVDEGLQLFFEVIELVKHKVGMLWLDPEGLNVQLPKGGDTHGQYGGGFDFGDCLPQEMQPHG
jgi:hypothetical protein